MFTFTRSYTLLYLISCAVMCVSCSSTNKVTGETDNNFQQPTYTFDYRFYRSQKDTLIDKLQEEDIQFVQYGETMTLVMPTDKYFSSMSTELKDEDYSGMNNVVKLLKLYPKSQINVAAFSDDSHTAESQKNLTQGLAERVLTYLWANGIPAQKLQAQGYGDKFPLGSNRQIHSSAYNRRIEIQWASVPNCCLNTKSTI